LVLVVHQKQVVAIQFLAQLHQRLVVVAEVALVMYWLQLVVLVVVEAVLAMKQAQQELLDRVLLVALEKMLEITLIGVVVVVVVQVQLVLMHLQMVLVVTVVLVSAVL
jgi:hypothetical protein